VIAIRSWAKLIVLGICLLSFPAQAETATDEITYLLDIIRHSPCVFIRNGKDYTGAAAADHISAKYEHFKPEIHTAEDFIDRAATKSELTGAPYQVRCGDGAPMAAADWLRTTLNAHRSATPGNN
jgi:hypothetical protein